MITPLQHADRVRSASLAQLASVIAPTTDAASLRVDLEPLVRVLGREVAVVESHLLHDDDMYAASTLEDRERVGVRGAEASVDGDVLSLTLPAVSWTAVRLA
jgi:alpha-N-arabinofuranosidase